MDEYEMENKFNNTICDIINEKSFIGTQHNQICFSNDARKINAPPVVDYKLIVGELSKSKCHGSLLYENK